jgi:hypothetical protein
MLDNF